MLFKHNDFNPYFNNLILFVRLTAKYWYIISINKYIYYCHLTYYLFSIVKII